MSEDLHKFLFLGVMIALTVFANKGPVNHAAILDRASFKAGVTVEPPAAAPLYVLESRPQILSDSALSPSAADASSSNDATDALVAEILGKAFVDATSAPTSTSASVDAPTAPTTKSSSAFLTSANSQNDSVFLRTGNENPPAVGAKIVLVADLATGESFYGVNPVMRWPIASVTKLMTAVISQQVSTTTDSITLTDGDLAVDGALDDIKSGESYSATSLRAAMLLESSNVAAIALSRARSYDNFMAMMNAQAKSWNLPDTYFDDPVGLSVANQSTAEDLLNLARHIFAEHDDILRVAQKKSAYITEIHSNGRILVKNINMFSGRPDFLGGKTGYTDYSNGNLLSIFSYKKRPIAIVVLGADDRFGDTQKLLYWFERNYK